MAYRVAICDDSVKYAEYIETILAKWAEVRGIEVYSEIFLSAESFMFRYAEDKLWDILLLDIEMKDMDGVTMAKEIRKNDKAVQIVFITGYSDYISEGYEVEALHYLVKPVNVKKFVEILDRAFEKNRQNERCLNLKYCGETVRIPFYEIRYIDVRLNYATVHAREDYTLKRPLAEFEKELDGRFIRIGRSVILNLKFIRSVSKSEVCLSNGEVLPLPRGAYEPLNRAIIERT